MSLGIVDTTVILHYLRKNPAARLWVDTLPSPLSVTTVTWMEVIRGSASKANLAVEKAVLAKFDLLYLTPTDQQWAMEQLERFQFTHHIGKDDCLIAAVAHRLHVPLYTHNLKDMTPLIGSLAVKPY